MALGSEVFERCLVSSRGWSPPEWDGVLVKGAVLRSLGPCTMWGHHEKVLSMNKEADPHQNKTKFMPWYWTPQFQNFEIKCFSFIITHSICWCKLAAWRDTHKHTHTHICIFNNLLSHFSSFYSISKNSFPALSVCPINICYDQNEARPRICNVTINHFHLSQCSCFDHFFGTSFGYLPILTIKNYFLLH